MATAMTTYPVKSSMNGHNANIEACPTAEAHVRSGLGGASIVIHG